MANPVVEQASSTPNLEKQSPITRQSGKQYVPLTCHGHSRPVTHLSFSTHAGVTSEQYYLISACKDNNPMLRDGVTGDWIGTFVGHKGAVYQARLSPNAAWAATAAADFTVRVWDTCTGATLYVLQHQHIVRAVAFAPHTSNILATGGMEKKLRIYDFTMVPLLPDVEPQSSKYTHVEASQAREIGEGVHKGTIKSIVWTKNPNVLVTAADDKVIRWWDVHSGKLLQEQIVDGEIGSCEFNAFQCEDLAENPIGGGEPVLSIAAGKTIYFFGGADARTLLKSKVLDFDVASVDIHVTMRRFIVGGSKITWVKVYDYDTMQELDVHKGHHGPVWSVSFSPDGKLYGTGSEDGTIKLWKNCSGNLGLWQSND